MGSYHEPENVSELTLKPFSHSPSNDALPTPLPHLPHSSGFAGRVVCSLLLFRRKVFPWRLHIKHLLRSCKAQVFCLPHLGPFLVAESWPLPLILALRRLRQEDLQFKASLGYMAWLEKKVKWSKIKCRMKDHVLLLLLLLTLLLQHTSLYCVLPLTPVCFHHSTGNLSWEEQRCFIQ